MTDDDYSKTPIIHNPWPEWIDLGNGISARRWTIEFVEPVSDGRLSSVILEQPDLRVRVERGASEAVLILTTTTAANPLLDETFFFVFYRLFEQLEAKLGRLKTIQGQARDLWRPFR